MNVPYILVYLRGKRIVNYFTKSKMINELL